MKKLLLILTFSILSFAQNLPTNSVVKIFASLSIPNYKYPWQTSQRLQVTGSGVIIKDNYIITNAHVISNAKFVQVSKDKTTKRYTAEIKYISHQADLALLEVKDKTFFNDTNPLTLTENISNGDNISVLGYPIGGDNLSTTKGVVSRIEFTKYSWSYERMLGIQVDASINSGNSGGAAINEKNEIVGIAMQGLVKSQSDNIAYIIPSIIVNTFLEDIKDGKVDGYENSSNDVQRLENEDLKSYYDIKDNKGVFLGKLEKDESTLKIGDIILKIEDNDIDNSGLVNTKYGPQSYEYYLHTKPVGKTVSMQIRRNNKVIDVEYTLKRKYELVKNERFKEPRYIIFGGLVFAPFTQNYLYENKLSSMLFETYYDLKESAKHVKEGVIVQAEKFNHPINEGYNPYIYLIYKVNGIKVIDFNHFVKLLDESKDKYTIFEFIDVENLKYVFDTQKARDSFEEIKNIYGLNTDRRVQ